MTDYQIWPATNGPGAATVDGGVVLATEFYVTGAGKYAKGLRFWRADTSILGPITARIYTVTDANSGTPLAGTDVTFTLSGTGWQTATFASPVLLTSGQRYRACAQFPTNYSATGSYWSSGGGSADIVNGPLTAPTAANTTGGDQGSFIVSASLAFPTNQFGSASYWVDATVTDTPGAVLSAAASGASSTSGTAAARLVLTAAAAGASTTTGTAASTVVTPATENPPGQIGGAAAAASTVTSVSSRTGGPA